MANQPEQPQEPVGTTCEDPGNQVCSLEHLVPVLALTGPQSLILAILALIAVVEFVVLPTVRGTRWDSRRNDDERSKRRLLKELDKHGDKPNGHST